MGKEEKVLRILLLERGSREEREVMLRKKKSLSFLHTNVTNEHFSQDLFMCRDMRNAQNESNPWMLQT